MLIGAIPGRLQSPVAVGRRPNIQIVREGRAVLDEAEPRLGLGAHQRIDGIARAFEIHLVDLDLFALEPARPVR
ncbi:hypothetical protein GCM10007920_01500 [Ciceribacter naphthalenivorans]|uniref:Uncharacterized protein n=2 Tax=Alphaproteobacteria TaxID=28211 RepID=A0A512HCQ8_9HYPH|nr:hypothetical protein RNA01_01710 [Ciceribacter naphthalenivorans]GLR20366.1 hypothetical protein GCM10007920_01500 [Ciceribacter naphthalenivorans]GLT03222.1 hypothetical protein GCM10007926_01500 [Sphingomonas psychrolutea]